MIGQTISHYKILEKLGQGGMGVVYKAQDTKLDRIVALKFLPQHITANESDKARFLQEAKAASAVNHPNVCVIYDIQEVDDHEFIVMEYVDGETLGQKLKSGQLPLKDVTNYAIQIAEALQEAHSNGIIHRDIKADNIMVNSKNQIKVMDFGLAKLKGSLKLTKTSSTIGTLSYMAPEQVQGTEVDARSDIFSFGVLLYEMLSGYLPFQGEYESAMMYSILNEEPESIQKYRTDLSSEYLHIINRSLEKDPENRYQNAHDIAIDLKRVLRDSDRVSRKSVPPLLNKDAELNELKRKGRLGLNFIIPVGILLILIISFLLLKPILFNGGLESAPIPVAVIPFENRIGDEEFDNLSELIQDLLITKLDNSEYIYVMTRERMNDLLKQLGKTGSTIDRELGFELCRLDSVETIVIGSVDKVGDLFVTNVKVLDVESKELINSATSQGQGVTSILKNQIDHLSADIAQGIGLTARKVAVNQQSIVDLTTFNTEAYQYYMQGISDLYNSNHEDARVMFEKAVQLDSTFAIAHLYLGTSYGRLRNNAGFLKAYKKAKALSHKAPHKERLLIEAFYVWYIEKDREKAFKIFNRLVKEYPKEKLLHVFLGIEYRTDKMYSESISEFNKALELDPQLGYAYEQLSRTYGLLEDHDNEILTLKQYASAVPGQANPYDRLGNIYFNMGQLDDALLNYLEAIKIQPEFRSNWKIAYIYALREDYSEAIKWINKYIMKARSPGPQGEGLWWKAFYHLWLGQYKLSISELKQMGDLADALENLYASAAVNWTRGMIYLELGEYVASRNSFNKVHDLRLQFFIDENPVKAMHYFYVGLIDVREGKIDSALFKLAEFEKLVPKIPSFVGQFYYNIFSAELFLLQDSLDKSNECWSKASSHKPYMSLDIIASHNVPFMKDCLARIYTKRGDMNNAIAEYERLISVDTREQTKILAHPKLHFRLAKLYEEKGDTEKAIKEYEKFLDIWKGADEDLPTLIDAKARYVKLVGAQ